MATKKQAQKSVPTTTTKKCAPACSSLPKKSPVVEAIAKTKENKTKTKIIARFDCGFPNSLFIRGEGIATLSWDKGAQMKNISPNEWLWESDRPCSTIQFKVLINDNCFEEGENHSIAFGQSVEFSPKF